jgi:hypothetical protein
LNYFIARSLRFLYAGEISNRITETPEEARNMLLLSLKRTFNYRGRELTQEQLDFLLRLRSEQVQSILNEWYRADNKYDNIVNTKIEQFSLTTTREVLLAKTKTIESPIFL